MKLQMSTNKAIRPSASTTIIEDIKKCICLRRLRNTNSELEPELLRKRKKMLFTMEQLELIRKLHVTGISSDQVLKAFGELEVPENPQNNNIMPAATAAAELYSPLLVQHLTSTPTTSSSAPAPSTTTTTTPSTPVKSVVLSSPASPPPPTVPKLNLTIQTVPTAVPVTLQVKSEGTSSSPSPAVFEHPICSSAPRPIRSQRTPMKEITTLDDPYELEEFMRQGEEACILDMKTFITQYSLRQTTVAMMTGVSQPYISKLLNGNHRELSLRCRKNIYCWYLNCRRHPTKLAAFLADPSTRLETNGDGELIPQRRERYVFRPILIRMLESFFAQTPFPDLPRRVEIATACNHVLQLDKKGVGLMPKEVVSPQVVSNWFANKRKELRRRSAEATAASTSSASSSASSVSSNLAINDSVSICSMSPSSRDEETMSRNTTPETTISSSPASFEAAPHSSPAPSSAVTSANPAAALATPSSSAIPPLIPPPTPSPLEVLAMAQRLGFPLPMLNNVTQFPHLPTQFVPFSMAPFYINPSILKSE